ncbi:hypothetical protein COPR103792_07205 [Corynebacterium propinquum]
MQAAVSLGIEWVGGFCYTSIAPEPVASVWAQFWLHSREKFPQFVHSLVTSCEITSLYNDLITLWWGILGKCWRWPDGGFLTAAGIVWGELDVGAVKITSRGFHSCNYYI